jgi:branched chain amino acid efflux pump
MKTEQFRQALAVTIPSFIAYFPLGIVFGVLFTHADYSWYLAPLMSALVYAGAVQFVALSMMIDNATLPAILFAGLFVALRNSFYGLSLIERFKPAPVLIRYFLIFGLVDASYAIFAVKPPKKNDIAFCFYTTLLLYVYWVSGSFIGAFFAYKIPDVKGLDFILTSFFAIIVIEYYLLNKKIDALLIPVVAAIIAYLLMPQFYLLIALFLCGFYLYMKIRLVL